MSSSTSIAVSGTNEIIHAAPSAGFWGLTLGSIGVVYGDIGTSPLYAMRESVLAAVGAGNPASEPVVLGILSLVIWALLIVVTAKYVLLCCTQTITAKAAHLHSWRLLNVGWA